MNRNIPTLLVAGFTFFGLFSQGKEYGDLNDALMRTMAQSAPPYHETKDTAQIRSESGVSPEPTTAPADTNPPAATEQTPSSP